MGQKAATTSLRAGLRKSILTSLIIGLAVVIAISLFSDLRAVGNDLLTFDWVLLPLILIGTVINYWLRWLKWDYYLRYLKLDRDIDRSTSGLIFTAGLVMSVTPGKMGEVLKSFLLRQRNGTPISRSAPIVLAERLTDGIAMLLLMGLGLTLYPPARPLFVILVLLTIIGIMIVQRQTLALAIIRMIARLPLGQRLAPRLETIYTTTAQLLHWRILLISTMISVISWGFECLAFFWVLMGVGSIPSWLLLLQATFIFAASTLFGLVSFLPGGLGASEVSSVGLLLALVGLSASAATTATIVIRFCTLWFGVLLGVVALAWLNRYPGTLREQEDLASLSDASEVL
ncbi:lysylphosphatidylglycerol synthase transmembrane domain-containing protein [Chloroflexus sp. MS-CIW-1]|uniref:lysylphosphatidylglycerol synthase transmembrane domain-containing protein n=1 Tax=Chloroflexus sp. MS-CIW-1 TaxID=3055768 RepID=UPI0026488F65|nr:lysylphosphatidylglycerol synthase transmembrane domain-containing protein [Chloroflexus sp. MS-CIW-1]MDN5272251.1 lysylphosphatidylglycerol synthase transmembrane domain-containing protein [Chloroflexus sp. MS-CIW-1]